MLHGNWYAEKTEDKDIRVKIYKWAHQKDPSTVKFTNDFNVMLYKPQE